MGTRTALALLLATACQAPPVGHTGFGSTPDISTTPPASTGEGSTSASVSETSTGESSGSGGGSTGSTSEPVRDLGDMPDFGGDSPVGCRGKIDFLFMISRDGNMQYRQEQLAAAFPQFIKTIQSKFADFDYHIMVVDGDGGGDGKNFYGWGTAACNELCPNIACKGGEPCCPWPQPAGEPCCGDADYPCEDLDLVTSCDWMWGTGTVFPAGKGSANKPCPIDGGRRYLVKGQSDLEGTFECIAKVGNAGNMMLGQALVAAVQHNLNGPGGCNGGFLRKDALLMVTFISTNPDVEPGPGPKTSEGTPAEWAQAVIDAKHGDDKSVVMLNIGGMDGIIDCTDPDDRLCVVTKMFPFHHLESALVADYGPAFEQAASLVETACDGFTPPPA